jgi:phosphoadenosine phosphosulfate reductase
VVSVAKHDHPRDKTLPSFESTSELVAYFAILGAKWSVEDRLARLREAVPGRIAFTTSFGIEDQAITHLVCSLGLNVDFVTIDTGRLFPATYDLWAKTEKRYDIRIRSVHPDSAAVANVVTDFGVNGFYSSKEARLSCCDVRKVEPLRRALSGAQAWITGLRAGQSIERQDVSLASWDVAHRVIKYAPLFDWSLKRVAEFCASEDVPVSELHADGFLSIGCEPCTRAVAPGEAERAGRWWWERDTKKECGLHLVDGKLVRAGMAG